MTAKRVSGGNDAGGSAVKSLRMAFDVQKQEQNAEAEEDQNDADEEMDRAGTAVKIDLDRNPTEASAASVGEVIYSGILDFKAAKGKATDDIVWEFSRLSPLKGEPNGCPHIRLGDGSVKLELDKPVFAKIPSTEAKACYLVIRRAVSQIAIGQHFRRGK